MSKIASTIVSTRKQAEANIIRFREQLKVSTALADRASYARAWYAHRDATGKWHFGPSKFIGYDGMTAVEYLDDGDRDGRVTERKLRDWFSVVDASDELYNELKDKLSAFLAEFGKVPSAAMRINVANSFYESQEAEQNEEPDRVLGDLIIAVAKRLSRTERKRVVAAL